MIIGWFKNFFSPSRSEAVQQGAHVFERKTKAKLIDLAEAAAMAEEAKRKKSSELLTMVRKGGVQIDRFRLWLKARRKVKKNLAKFYDESDIADEVTERIVEAAMEDPRIRKLFG